MCLNEVIEFITRRFSIDCNWTSGNCYYFAVILKDRFPEGKLVYEVIDGHFLFDYKGKLYDFNGEQQREGKCLVDWDTFDDYDSKQKCCIIRDCIK